MSKRFLTFFLFGILSTGTLSFSHWHATTPLSPATNAITSLQNSADRNTLADNKKNKYNRSASVGENDGSGRLESLGITLHPGSEFTSDDHPTPSSLNHCKSLAYRTFKNLPAEVSSQIKNLTLYFSDEGRRGLAGGSTMILRCQNVTEKEFVAVATHESGHVIDTGRLQGTFFAGASEFHDGSNVVYRDDPSLIFYRLSFKDEKTLREDASAEDFISGYASSDPFEDFAETYCYYILHGNEFRALKATNKVLGKKYAFMKIWVFHGKEFHNGDDHSHIDPMERDYDTTVLDYDLQKFFVL